MGTIHKVNTAFTMPPIFGSVETDENAESIARLPGLVEWWCAHPSYLTTESDGKMRWDGRFAGKVMRTPSSTVPVKTQGLNGRHTLEFNGSQQFDAPTFVLPENDFTVAAIIRLTQGSGVITLFGPDEAAASGTKCYGYAFNAGAARVVNSAFSSLVTDPSGTYANLDATIMTTQSSSDGLSMWRNGEEVVVDGTKTSDLDDRTFGIANFGIGTASEFVGEISDVLVFDVNYRSETYASANETLQSVLSEWAGV